ncbi:acyltransferase [Bradyrhizobium liaoningense]|uniref:acyltransferase n=1 Tax=Bradyrhizobium liaoningense TaxID=43992 RepID=UPI001BA68F57|nr:acyltransferase [Bradyrhizobium liaoningense]MBR0843869.1 acyltransferase [Bradyrhizobium liaoningense]
MTLRHMIRLVLKRSGLWPRTSQAVGPAEYPYYSLGENSLVETLSVQVRNSSERRPFLVIGKSSYISGTYVFERGIGQITIGDQTFIGSGSLFICAQQKGISIGNHVLISWGCTVSDTNAHSLDANVRRHDVADWLRSAREGKTGAYKNWEGVKSAPIVIEDDAWLGFGVVILKGVTIGAGAVVGARSVVTRDVAPNTVVAGNPARVMRGVSAEEARNEFA